MIKDIPRSVIIKKMVAGGRTCTADATPFKSPLYYLSYPAIPVAAPLVGSTAYRIWSGISTVCGPQLRIWIPHLSTTKDLAALSPAPDLGDSRDGLVSPYSSPSAGTLCLQKFPALHTYPSQNPWPFLGWLPSLQKRISDLF